MNPWPALKLYYQVNANQVNYYETFDVYAFQKMKSVKSLL